MNSFDETLSSSLSQNIPTLINSIDSTDIEILRSSVSSVRRALSIENNPPIDYVIKYGFVPRLIQLLHYDDPVIQEEAAWALTNIASGNQENTFSVVNLNIIPSLTSLLSSVHPRIVDQSIWGLGNIAGDGVTLRNQVLEQGVLPVLLGIFEKYPRNTSIMRNACWALSNLFRGKPLSDNQYVELALPTIAALLNIPDNDALCDVLWCLSYISDTSNDRMQKVLDCNVVDILIKILTNPERQLVSPALRTLGNFLTGDDKQTQYVLDCGALNILKKLLTHEKSDIRKEVCWCFSNITSGNRAQIQQVIDSEALREIIEKSKTDNSQVKKEAIWAISNACCGGSKEQIDYLVKIGSIPALMQGTKVADDITKIALEGLHYIFKAGATVGADNTFKKQFQESRSHFRQALIPTESRYLFESILTMMGEDPAEYDFEDGEGELYDDEYVDVNDLVEYSSEEYDDSSSEEDNDSDDDDNEEDEEDDNQDNDNSHGITSAFLNLNVE